jgi:hypothetical protein
MKPIDYFNESLDDRMSTEEVTPKKRLGKIKSFALAAAVAATLACGSAPKVDDGLKRFYHEENYQKSTDLEFYSNYNSSIIKIDIEGKEEYLYRGPPLKSLFELDDRKLRIIKYVDKRTGAFNKSRVYDNPQNNVDEAFLTAKDSQGKAILRSRAYNMPRYLRR